jgi:hypothetical protein
MAWRSGLGGLSGRFLPLDFNPAGTLGALHRGALFDDTESLGAGISREDWQRSQLYRIRSEKKRSLSGWN